jgi:hypothetical protein
MASESSDRADKKSPGRGRPLKRETAAGVDDTQAVLSYLRTRGHAVSSVSGKPLGLRALAYVIWYEQKQRADLQEQGHKQREAHRQQLVEQSTRRQRPQPVAPEPWTPPQGASWAMPPIGPNLDEERQRAIATVRKTLLERAHQHVERAKREETVSALRMTVPGRNGPNIVPALDRTWPGLPGLYSFDWPTTVGLKGEASLELSEEAVRRGGFALVTLDAEETRAVWARLRDQPPDDAAIAEEVARHYGRATSQSAERKLRRLIREAQSFEYVHLGDFNTGKKPLPPIRP